MGLNKRNAVHIAEWERLIASLEANAAELPHLEASRIELQQKLQQIQALSGEQAMHQAAKQEASKGVASAIQEGRHLATFLRTGAKQRFGKESEKMVEFGIAPYRGNKRRLPSETPEPPAPPGSRPGGSTPSA